MKRGEKEAKIILESLGNEFDDSYYDDNSSESMPDLRFKGGKYLEVTHTGHNMDPLLHPEKYCPKTINDELEYQNKISEAFERISNLDYERDERFEITKNGQKKFKKDLTIVKKGLGYDPTQIDIRKQHSEFGCSNPSFFFDVENILEKIIEKASKHAKDNADLFIFAQEDELRFLIEDIKNVSTAICRCVKESPFEKIYVCEWDIEHQKYNLNNPNMVCLTQNQHNQLEVALYGNVVCLGIFKEI